MPQEIFRKEIMQPKICCQFLFLFNSSKNLTFVPALKNSPRAPFGPSLVLIEGMPFEGIETVLHISAALRRETFTLLIRGNQSSPGLYLLALQESELLPFG